MSRSLRIIFLVTLFYNFAIPQQVPRSFKVCSKSSSNLAECVKNAIEHLRPHIKTGNFGDGLQIDGIEPIFIDDIIIDRGSGFHFDLKNIKAYHVSNFRIDKIRANVQKNVDVDVILDIPNVEADGDYKINIVLGVLPIAGQGKFKCLIENIKVRLKLHGVIYLNNGVEYLKFTTIDTKVKLGKASIKLHNLFQDKVLSDVGDNLVNQNLPSFHPDIEPKVQASLNKFAFKSANQVVQRIPFKYLFPA